MTVVPPLPALLLLCASAVAVLVLARRTGVGRHGTLEEYQTGGRLLSPAENGLAAAGEHPSAAVLLPLAGAAALGGPAGPLCAAALLSAWPLVLLLVAEAVRNCGRFTLADVVVLRFGQRSVRTAAGVVSVAVSVLCVAAQTAGAIALVGLLTVGAEPEGPVLCVAAGAGALVVLRGVYGGMRTTTRILTAVTVPLLVGVCALAVFAPPWTGTGPDASVGSAAVAAAGSGDGDVLSLFPGHDGGGAGKADLVALGLALVLGAAGLPHVLARLTAVPTARAARRSAVWSAGTVGLLCPAAVVLGLGAAAAGVTGGAAGPVGNGPAAPGNAAVPLLVAEAGGGVGAAGGAVLPAAVVVVCLTATAAAVAGTALASAASVVRDLRLPVSTGARSSLARRRRGPGAGFGGGRSGSEVPAARAAAMGVTAAGVAAGALLGEAGPVLVLGSALAVAASTNLPVLLYTLFWRRFTARGARWALHGGLVSAVGLTILSPLVSGHPQALLPELDLAVFPLCNPAPVSVPIGFLAGLSGTLLSRREAAGAVGHAETEVRALTGTGAV
ncbi:cation acetate symporter [Streptomyces sp. TRM43335]|uniref:Cation acetate symporter n=1 Tax=Streptomyces taklimakanensis TaxID=2569853 RepID=A0A6G2BH13_9ACTN|nr:cation acetate symporter [Streptomyces taklimakanensis]MTE21353.1 cation acetate symporter [Streptomyces taklimakanensis]